MTDPVRVRSAVPGADPREHRPPGPRRFDEPGTRRHIGLTHSQTGPLVPGELPLELDLLLHAPDTEREAAWQSLIARHSRLLLSVARSFGGGRDAAMERYAYILEKLSEDHYRRLRAFEAGGKASFSTWLTVAARRLCLDHHRTRYGRSRPTRDPGRASELRGLRRRLADADTAEVDPDQLPDAAGQSAEAEAIHHERDRGLHQALQALPPQDRLLVMLRFEDDLSAARIAGIVGLATPFHVYRRLNAILARLRAALEARGIEDSSG